MKVREITKDPDKVLSKFDYFNDFADTDLYLSVEIRVLQDIQKKLREGKRKYQEQFRNKKHHD